MLTRTVEPEYLNDDDVMMAGLEAVDEGFLQVGDWGPTTTVALDDPNVISVIVVNKDITIDNLLLYVEEPLDYLEQMLCLRIMTWEAMIHGALVPSLHGKRIGVTRQDVKQKLLNPPGPILLYTQRIRSWSYCLPSQYVIGIFSSRTRILSLRAT